jgi:hypothetical protein
MTPLDFALAYAAAGVPVFPVHTVLADGSCSCGSRKAKHKPGKHPRTAHGHDDATTNADVIRQWWTMWPDARIGADLRAAGIVDVSSDSAEWLAIFEERGLPPDAPRYQSASGPGHVHILTRRPDGCPTTRRCMSGQYDILSEGYAILPNADTPAPGVYGWITPFPSVNLNGGLPLTPAWSSRMLREKPAKPSRPRSQRATPAGALPLDAADEPPVELDAHALEVWQGKHPIADDDGSIARGRSLARIGRVLHDAKMTRRGKVRELRARDHALNWHKFCCAESGRSDWQTDNQYDAIVDLLEQPQPRAHVFIGGRHLCCRDGGDDPATQAEADDDPCAGAVASLQAEVTYWKERAIRAEGIVEDLREIQRDSLALRRNTHVKTVAATAQALAYELASPAGAANVNDDASVTVRRRVLAENSGRSADVVSDHLDWFHDRGLLTKQTVKVWRPVVDRETGEVVERPSKDIRITLPCAPREWLKQVAAYTPPADTPTHGGRRVPSDGCHPGAKIVRKDHCGTCDRILGAAAPLSRQDAAIGAEGTMPVRLSTPIRQDDVIGDGARRRVKDPPDGFRECALCKRLSRAEVCEECERATGQTDLFAEAAL